MRAAATNDASYDMATLSLVDVVSGNHVRSFWSVNSSVNWDSL